MIVRSESGDETPITLTFGTRPTRTTTLLGNIMIANLTSSTSAELLIVAVYTYDNIAQSNFESISVVVQRPDYGWECVNMYVAVLC